MLEQNIKGEKGLMEDLSKLESKVKHLEYTELKEVKEKINSVEISLAKNTQLTESLIETNSKLDTTMNSVRDSLLIMSESMKQSNAKVDGLSKKVDSMNGRIDDIDNKDKISTNELLTNSIKSIIEKVIIFAIGGGIVAYVIKIM